MPLSSFNYSANKQLEKEKNFSMLPWTRIVIVDWNENQVESKQFGFSDFHFEFQLRTGGVDWNIDCKKIIQYL